MDGIRHVELRHERAARVRAALRISRGRYTSNAALGVDLGISGSLIGQLLAAKPKNPSLRTAGRVAEMLGVSLPSLLGDSVGDADLSGPCHARAAALTRLRGLLSPDTEAWVLSVVLPLTELEWCEYTLSQERHCGHMRSLQTTANATASPTANMTMDVDGLAASSA